MHIFWKVYKNAFVSLLLFAEEILNGKFHFFVQCSKDEDLDGLWNWYCGDLKDHFNFFFFNIKRI